MTISLRFVHHGNPQGQKAQNLEMYFCFKSIYGSSGYKYNFYKVPKRARSKRRPMVITENGESAGVLMDIEYLITHQVILGAKGCPTFY